MVEKSSPFEVVLGVAMVILAAWLTQWMLVSVASLLPTP